MNLRIVGGLVGLVAAILIVSTASAKSITVKQASVTDQQATCAGSTISSAHFVINQIDAESNAPGSISVTWSNGDVDNVLLDRFTGKVAHYTVEGSSTHTQITTATADIYDGWGGQFNLSSVECGPPLDACVPFADRIIIPFNVLLGNPLNGLLAESNPVAINVPAGTYAVTLQSFDEHTGPTGHGGQGQVFEQWFARFTAGGTVDTAAIGDLPDNLNTLNQGVGTVTFTSTATQVVARHLLADTNFSTSDLPESITAVCVALDPQ